MASQHYVDEGVRVVRLGNTGAMSCKDEDRMRAALLVTGAGTARATLNVGDLRRFRVLSRRTSWPWLDVCARIAGLEKGRCGGSRHKHLTASGAEAFPDHGRRDRRVRHHRGMVAAHRAISRHVATAAKGRGTEPVCAGCPPATPNGTRQSTTAATPRAPSALTQEALCTQLRAPGRHWES